MASGVRAHPEERRLQLLGSPDGWSQCFSGLKGVGHSVSVAGGARAHPKERRLGPVLLRVGQRPVVREHDVACGIKDTMASQRQ